MSCPDEDTFARFVEGVLTAEAAAAIESHVDGCARCADLAAEFGRSFAEERTDVAGAAPRPGRLAPLALAAAALLHAVWAIVIVPAAAPLAGAAPGPLVAGYLRYAALWAPAGAVLALVGAFAVLRGVRAGRWLALGWALLSLPSIVLTPLALFALDAERRERTAASAAVGTN